MAGTPSAQPSHSTAGGGSLRLGIAGLGTVGVGVLRLLADNAELLRARAPAGAGQRSVRMHPASPRRWFYLTTSCFGGAIKHHILVQNFRTEGIAPWSRPCTPAAARHSSTPIHWDCMSGF